MSDTQAVPRTIRYDAPIEPAAKTLHTPPAALRGMLELERRLKALIARQLEAHPPATSADAARVIARIDLMTDVHLRGLEERVQHDGRGDAVTAVRMPGREGSLSAALRDDYGLLSLAAIGYTMLRTTALAFADEMAVALADQHLDDVNGVIAEIARIMPAVLLQELLDDGLDIGIQARQRALRLTHESWRSQP